jgi:hypothetical protein
MGHHKNIVGVILSLSLLVLNHSVTAGLLTPLTSETWVQVEIATLQYRVAETQQRLDSLSNTGATPDTSVLDAAYKKFNTNFMEHLRYGDTRKKEIKRWLEQNIQQKFTLEQLKSQMDRLSSQLEANESN